MFFVVDCQLLHFHVHLHFHMSVSALKWWQTLMLCCLSELLLFWLLALHVPFHSLCIMLDAVYCIWYTLISFCSPWRHAWTSSNSCNTAQSSCRMLLIHQTALMITPHILLVDDSHHYISTHSFTFFLHLCCLIVVVKLVLCGTVDLLDCPGDFVWLCVYFKSP